MVQLTLDRREWIALYGRYLMVQANYMEELDKFVPKISADSRNIVLADFIQLRDHLNQVIADQEAALGSNT